MQDDVRRVVTRVEAIEEEVSAIKSYLRRQTRGWKRFRERFRNMRRKFSRWKRFGKNKCWSWNGGEDHEKEENDGK